MAENTEESKTTAPDTLSASARQTRTSLNLATFALLIFAFFAEPFECGIMKIGLLGNSFAVQDQNVFFLLCLLVAYFLFSFLLSVLYDGTKPLSPNSLLKHVETIEAAEKTAKADITNTHLDLGKFMDVVRDQHEIPEGVITKVDSGSKSDSRNPFASDVSLLNRIATRISLNDENYLPEKDKQLISELGKFRDRLTTAKRAEFKPNSGLEAKLRNVDETVRLLLQPISNLHSGLRREAEAIRVTGTIKITFLDQWAPLAFGCLVLIFSLVAPLINGSPMLSHDFNKDYSIVAECVQAR